MNVVVKNVEKFVWTVLEKMLDIIAGQLKKNVFRNYARNQTVSTVRGKRSYAR